jgi:hypothetical protein
MLSWMQPTTTTSNMRSHSSIVAFSTRFLQGGKSKHKQQVFATDCELTAAHHHHVNHAQPLVAVGLADTLPASTENMIIS